MQASSQQTTTQPLLGSQFGPTYGELLVLWLMYQHFEFLIPPAKDRVSAVKDRLLC